jgi:hypothetical protein
MYISILVIYNITNVYGGCIIFKNYKVVLKYFFFYNTTVILIISVI